MAPNVTIKYMANTEKTRMKLKYHVYNCYNVLQWPESYSFELTAATTICNSAWMKTKTTLMLGFVGT
ncbi:hypothetical protein QOT17_024444 [Balamuthia mandrillaris]